MGLHRGNAATPESGSSLGCAIWVMRARGKLALVETIRVRKPRGLISDRRRIGGQLCGGTGRSIGDAGTYAGIEALRERNRSQLGVYKAREEEP